MPGDTQPRPECSAQGVIVGAGKMPSGEEEKIWGEANIASFGGTLERGSGGEGQIISSRPEITRTYGDA